MTKRLYVIGDKQTGVAFVTLDPLRASLVSLDEIKRYATDKGKTPDAVFGDIAKAIQGFILKYDNNSVPSAVAPVPEAIGALIAGGSTISDAEFCFVADIKEMPVKSFRNPFDPIEPTINHMSDGTPGFDAKAFPTPLD
ncbi:MAG: hypothetical protein ACKVRO_15570 [Micropepsaceae bacterium]